MERTGFGLLILQENYSAAHQFVRLEALPQGIQLRERNRKLLVDLLCFLQGMQALFRIDSLQLVLELSFEISEGLVEKLKDVSFGRGELVLDDCLHALHLSDYVGLA